MSDDFSLDPAAMFDTAASGAAADEFSAQPTSPPEHESSHETSRGRRMSRHDTMMKSREEARRRTAARKPTPPPDTDPSDVEDYVSSSDGGILGSAPSSYRDSSPDHSGTYAPSHTGAPLTDTPHNAHDNSLGMSRGPLIPPEKDMMVHTRRIISTYVTYTSLSERDRDITARFVGADSKSDSDDYIPFVVVRAMNAPKDLRTAMAHLRQLKAMPAREERAFTLMEIPDHALRSLGTLLSSIIGETISHNGSTVDYCRTLENCIDGISDDIISSIESAQRVMDAAQT